MCTVVDDLRGAHAGTSLSVVETDAVAAADNKRSVHAVAPEGVYSNLADLMCGKFGDIAALVTESGQRHCNSGFAASGNDPEILALDETYQNA